MTLSTRRVRDTRNFHVQASIFSAAVVALSATSGDGGVFAWQNPTHQPIIITRVTIDITTAAPATVTIDVGTTANGASASDNLIDGGGIAATGVLDNIEDRGTNGKSRQRLAGLGGATDFVTGTASAAPTGLVGFAYIEYIVTRS